MVWAMVVGRSTCIAMRISAGESVRLRSSCESGEASDRVIDTGESVSRDEPLPDWFCSLTVSCARFADLRLSTFRTGRGLSSSVCRAGDTENVGTALDDADREEDPRLLLKPELHGLSWWDNGGREVGCLGAGALLLVV